MTKDRSNVPQTLHSKRQPATSRLNMVYRQVSRLQAELAVRGREAKVLEAKLKSLENRCNELSADKKHLLNEAQRLEKSAGTQPHIDFAASLS